MIRKNQRFLNFINVISDFIIINFAYALSILVWLGNQNNLGNNISQSIYLVLIYSLLSIIIFKVFNLYDSYRFKTIISEQTEIIKASSITILLFGLSLFVFRLEDFSRGVLVLTYALTIVLVGLKRVFLRRVLRKYRKLGFNQKKVIVIGSGNLSKRYIEGLNNNPQFGFTIKGYISDNENKELGERLGGYVELNDVLQKVVVDEVVIALEPHETGIIRETIDICEKHGMKIYIIPIYNDYIPTTPSVDSIEDIKLINMRTIPLDSDFCALQKRAFDIVLSLILIVISSPFMFVAMIGTKITSPGPIIFKQERVGRNKKIFTMYKFRSMKITGTETTGWTTDKDTRKTAFGSFIRKTSIDELPQFFNVLKGDMTIVGPRPEVPFHVEHFKEEIPLYMVKHQVRPGITGWAQVHGLRGDTSIVDRIKHDIWYIENWNIFLDIKIVFLTVFGGKIINNEKMVNVKDEGTKNE